jgi:DNA-binding NarL/FixJ family response regulator
MPTIKIRKQPTRLEIAILQMLIDGKSQKQIALELHKSLSTIKQNLARARKHAGVDSLYRLIAISIVLGWCSLDIDPPDRALLFPPSEIFKNPNIS